MTEIDSENLPMVVTSDTPNIVESFAASELSRCVGKVFSTKASVVVDESSATRRDDLKIYVGKTTAAEDVWVEALALKTDCATISIGRRSSV